ncbi:sensor histidine kinase [Pseudaestuariivita atlantica]|uniref:histidine kinase n=1 Tax=Pseudaestuariivita atlantica TaxID=1317121 RepID=A0A0L1JS87_9RHOB|nr:HAMP domain-containing sensor histidine kinase [Pseudaestuariivita atlantica]KNG94606.1 hypothetical protein ATO11_04165 [Pseudaestuariivita atlantica]
MTSGETRQKTGRWWRQLHHSAPMRHTLLLLAVFIAIDVLSLGAAYLKLRADVARELAAELRREAAGLDLTATPNALSTIVAARARVSDPAEMVMVFLRSDGRQVGNVRAAMRGGEIALVPREGGEPLAPAGYLREPQELAGGILILGVSLAPLDDLRRNFLLLFLISIVPTAALSLLAGVAVARRDARRVSDIERTLDQLTGGDLTARADPPTGSDDMARIALGVNRLASKQQNSIAALRQVSTDIAHDLKTPLQRVSGLLEDLQRSVEGNAEAEALAGQAAHEVRRAGSVFNAMVRIAMVEGSDHGQNFTIVDLGKIAKDIAELYQPTIEDAGKTLQVDIDERTHPIKGDAELLGQAVSNLLENALVHTPAGTEITVSVEESSDGVSLIVADTGSGIPEGERGKVTQRFYRLERSRSTPGHGLGLSLVAAVAELHSAEMMLADNEPGLRATIRFKAV